MFPLQGILTPPPWKAFPLCGLLPLYKAFCEWIINRKTEGDRGMNLKKLGMTPLHKHDSQKQTYIRRFNKIKI